MNTNKNHSHALFKVLGLLLGVTLLWVAAGAIAHAQATSSGQDWVAAPNPAAAPEAQTPPTVPAPGVYVFLDWRNMNPQQYPFVVGGHQVFKWDRVRGRRSGRIQLGSDRTRGSRPKLAMASRSVLGSTPTTVRVAAAKRCPPGLLSNIRMGISPVKASYCRSTGQAVTRRRGASSSPPWGRATMMIHAWSGLR